MRRAKSQVVWAPAPHSGAVNAVIGSAVAVSGGGEPQSKLMPVEDWQALLWSWFDVVGELSFGAAWQANALSRITLHAAKRGAPGTPPTRIDDESNVAVGIMRQFAGGPAGQSEMLRQQGFHLAIPGDTYLVTEPDELGSLLDGETFTATREEIKQVGAPPDARYQLQLDPSKWVDLHPDTLVTKIMQCHPRRRWEPWSANRAALPILAELRLLSQHIVASAQSRLSGAGLLVYPSEVHLPVDPRHANAVNPFMSLLAEAMQAARANPDGPEAMTPITLGVPGEYADKFHHVTFSTPFDERVLELRESATKRYASTIDLPAEVLLGIADLQHWNAWAVSEQAQKFHIEPKMMLICHALSTRALQPILRALGMGEAEAEDYVVWYDASELSIQPDRGPSADALQQDGVISAAARRRENGFTEDDAPSKEETDRRVILDIIKGAPTLAPLLLPMVGIDVPVPEEAVQAIVGETTESAPAPAPSTTVEVPANPSVPSGGRPQAAALAAAADGLVFHALERAGARLRSKNPAVRAAAQGRPNHATHTVAASLASTDELDDALAGAWVRVPELAARHRVDPDALTATLDVFARALLTQGAPYDVDRVAEAVAWLAPA